MKVQLEAQLVRAGAGTGKTESLVKEVYRIFKKFRETENRHPRLIVCTFTRKASQELKERLLKEAVKEFDNQNKKNPNREKSGEGEFSFVKKEKTAMREVRSFF